MKINVILLFFIALEHFYILWLEMFAWETAGKKAFKGAMPSELFGPTKVMAANQGLYNGFLGAGLIWAYFTHQISVCYFFLILVLIAGVFGGFTASKKIFFIQAIPALIAILAFWLNI